ncbi:MAG: methyltransferase domain-containing protein [Gemmatimonadota bacterium]
MNCCDHGLTDVFTEDAARKDANRYRKRGLPRRARKLIKAIEAAEPLANKTTLEVGVGAGGVTVEMLRRGAAHAVGVDAVAEQLAAARSLATDFGVANQLELIHREFTDGSGVQQADVVVMDRVVCCYADWQSLLGAAAARANSLIALTYPRDVWWLKLFARVVNLWWLIVRSEFRFRVHSVSAMHALLAARGFAIGTASHYLGWEIITARR